MAHKHQLMLEIPDTNNKRVFLTTDVSLYAPDIPVTCGTLQIIPPGFNVPIAIEVLQNFNLVLNACSLGIQNAGCGEVSRALPDGIYAVKYSIAPNDKVFVEYSHLRITQTMNKYYTHLASLDLGACEPARELAQELDRMRLIKSFFDAAKANVEVTHDPAKGMQLLLTGQKWLNKLTENC